MRAKLIAILLIVAAVAASVASAWITDFYPATVISTAMCIMLAGNYFKTRPGVSAVFSGIAVVTSVAIIYFQLARPKGLFF